MTCVTLAGNESHPSAADEDKGLTESEVTSRPLKKGKKAGEPPKTFYFFTKVGDNDRWLCTRRVSRKSSGGAASDYLQETRGKQSRGVEHHRQTAGPYGDDAAQTARQHMAWLRNGELASTRPQNHSSVIKYGVNTKLHRTSQCGTGGDPPHVACFSYLNSQMGRPGN